MVNLHVAGQFDDTIAALWRARADVRDAIQRADDLPRAFGRSEAVAELGAGLDASAGKLEQFAGAAASVDASLGTTFTELAQRLRTAAPLADSRAGVAALRQELADLRQTLSTSFDHARTTRASQLFPTPEAVDVRLREFATHGPDAMTRQRWIELADIAALPAQRRSALMDDRFDKHATWASRLVDVGFDPIENPHVVTAFNAWRAPIAFPDRASATERVAHLASVPPSRLTRAELYDLHAISTLDQGHRPEWFNAFTLDDALEAAMSGTGLTARSETAGRLRGIESTKVWPSREHAQRAALDLIGDGPSTMTAERMDVFASIAELPRTHGVGIGKFARVRDLATDLQSAGSLPKLEAMTTERSGRARHALLTDQEEQGIIRSWLNELRGPAQWPTREAATSRLQDIAMAGRTEGRLTPREIDDLDALSRLDDSRRPTTLEKVRLGFRPPAYRDADRVLDMHPPQTVAAWLRGADS